MVKVRGLREVVQTRGLLGELHREKVQEGKIFFLDHSYDVKLTAVVYVMVTGLSKKIFLF